MESVKSVDAYCADINQTMITAQLQAKASHEQMGICKTYFNHTYIYIYIYIFLKKSWI